MSDRPSFPPAVLEALRKGNQLEAIKLLREASKTGLVEAKALVDAMQGAKAARAKEATPPRPPSVGAVARTVSRPPIPGYVPHSKSGLSPGEVPRTGGNFWWVLVLIVGVVVLFALP